MLFTDILKNTMEVEPQSNLPTSKLELFSLSVPGSRAARLANFKI